MDRLVRRAWVRQARSQRVRCRDHPAILRRLRAERARLGWGKRATADAEHGRVERLPHEPGAAGAAADGPGPHAAAAAGHAPGGGRPRARRRGRRRQAQGHQAEERSHGAAGRHPQQGRRAQGRRQAGRRQAAAHRARLQSPGQGLRQGPDAADLEGHEGRPPRGDDAEGGRAARGEDADRGRRGPPQGRPREGRPAPADRPRLQAEQEKARPGRGRPADVRQGHLLGQGLQDHGLEGARGRHREESQGLAQQDLPRQSEDDRRSPRRRGPAQGRGAGARYSHHLLQGPGRAALLRDLRRHGFLASHAISRIPTRA
mmetsp:Transcript_101682/g.287889  ORF Transcript_101682/g.287889 Transcript_101682/m.287889 type:complete len:316 (+) Transcript_101682:625-1572(+)